MAISKLIAILLFLLLPFIGFYLGMSYQKNLSGILPVSIENTMEKKVPATKKDCLAVGGVWQVWGIGDREFCQIPAQDSDKSCTDGTECSYGKCISEKSISPGRCATYKLEFGCYSVIEKGKVNPAICVD